MNKGTILIAGIIKIGWKISNCSYKVQQGLKAFEGLIFLSNKSKDYFFQNRSLLQAKVTNLTIGLRSEQSKRSSKAQFEPNTMFDISNSTIQIRKLKRT